MSLDLPIRPLPFERRAAAYLGGIRFQSLARAGRATGSPAALRLADALFASDLTPYNPEIF